MGYREYESGETYMRIVDGWSNNADVYLLSWTYENSYLYIWAVALLLLLFKKKIIAYAIALGNIAGLIGGHVLDKIIMPIRMAEITEDMSAGEVVRM